MKDFEDCIIEEAAHLADIQFGYSVEPVKWKSFALGRLGELVVLKFFRGKYNDVAKFINPKDFTNQLYDIIAIHGVEESARRINIEIKTQAINAMKQCMSMRKGTLQKVIGSDDYKPHTVFLAAQAYDRKTGKRYDNDHAGSIYSTSVLGTPHSFTYGNVVPYMADGRPMYPFYLKDLHFEGSIDQYPKLMAIMDEWTLSGDPAIP